jgi:hypothetical protein
VKLTEPLTVPPLPATPAALSSAAEKSGQSAAAAAAALAASRHRAASVPRLARIALFTFVMISCLG